MIIPSVILSWPRHVDYPLFRYRLKVLEEWVDRIYIIFTAGTGERDLAPFITDQIHKDIKNVEFIYPQQNYDDWRQCAVREVIDNKLHSEYVLFLEQDFLMTYNFLLFFFSMVMEYDESSFFSGYKEGERIHPAFSLVKTSLIEATSKEFSARPPGHDHFGLFFEELSKNHAFTNIVDLGLKEGKDFYHMAGLTQNYHVFRENQPFYKPNEFLTYNTLSLNLPIVHHPEFKQLCRNIEAKHGPGDSDVVRSFFTLV